MCTYIHIYVCHEDHRIRERKKERKKDGKYIRKKGRKTSRMVRF